MKFYSRLATIALLAGATLPAATITSYFLEYNGSSIGSGSNNVSDFFLEAGTQSDGITVTGTLDLFQGGSPVTTGVPLTGPVSLRFTDASLTCASSTFCSPITLFFAAYVFFEGTAPTQLQGLFGVEGSGTTPNFLNATVAGQNDAPFLGNVSTNGAFDESLPLPANFMITNGSNMAEFRFLLQLPAGMSNGETISLPNSLFQQLNTSGSSVPEPGTVAIVGAGLLGAFWFRRRQR